MCVADTLWSKAGFVKVMTRKLGCWVGWIAIDIYIYIYIHIVKIYTVKLYIYIYIYKDSLHFTPCENPWSVVYLYFGPMSWTMNISTRVCWDIGLLELEVDLRWDFPRYELTPC